MTITLETLRTCKLRNVGHFRGSGFFGDMHQCIEHPRLKLCTTYHKKSRHAELRWLIDGQPVDNLQAAAAALNVPPKPTPQMIETLAGIGTEFADYRRLTPFDRLHALSDMGLIEWGERGHCRLSDGGRLALHHAGLLL